MKDTVVSGLYVHLACSECVLTYVHLVLDNRTSPRVYGRAKCKGEIEKRIGLSFCTARL